MPISSPFLFAITNPGSEKPLKMEVSQAGLTWRPGFQQRGFVTFKHPENAPEGFQFQHLKVPLALARRVCLFAGKFPNQEDAEAALRVECGEKLQFLDISKRPEPKAESPLTLTKGEIVGTVVKLNENEYWGGWHTHEALRSPYPGGSSGVILNPASPSRAWLKLEEATRFFGLQFTPKDIVVELGCSPGGVLLALVDRGISSIGVDPAKLAETLSPHILADLPYTKLPKQPWIWHCRKPAALVGKRDLAVPVTWFMSDMNQAPAIAIKECGRFIRMCPTIRSALITLKMKELTELADQQVWMDEMRAMGFRIIRLQQLSVHHHEVSLLALGRL